jgi:hypothetical protein
VSSRLEELERFGGMHARGAEEADEREARLREARRRIGGGRTRDERERPHGGVATQIREGR